LTRVDLKEKKFKGFLTKGRPLLLRLAVVSQSGKSHFPHVSSVWYLFRDDCFWISTSEDRLKVKAIRQNDRVALIIDNDFAPYKGIIVEGKATLTKVTDKGKAPEDYGHHVLQEIVKLELSKIGQASRTRWYEFLKCDEQFCSSKHG
jgi:nitroimidazol reductase NimA-like FMN-containing flavoprotein (pyridoxamine 5'-phosphate oxidase superfamily)